MLCQPTKINGDINNCNILNLPRVINLSSLSEAWGPKYCQLNDIFDTNIKQLKFMGSLKSKYNPFENYGISKTCNILFTRQLANKYKNKLIVVSCHPGFIMTGLQSNMDLKDLYQMIRFVRKNKQHRWRTGWENVKTIEQGAATTIRCVSMNQNEIKSGKYYYNCHIGDFRLKGAASQDIDGILAKKLWDLSTKLIQSKGYSLEDWQK